MLVNGFKLLVSRFLDFSTDLVYQDPMAVQGPASFLFRLFPVVLANEQYPIMTKTLASFKLVRPGRAVSARLSLVNILLARNAISFINLQSSRLLVVLECRRLMQRLNLGSTG